MWTSQGFHPTSRLTLSQCWERRDLEISEFYVEKERGTTDNEAPKLWKGRSGSQPIKLLFGWQQGMLLILEDSSMARCQTHCEYYNQYIDTDSRSCFKFDSYYKFVSFRAGKNWSSEWEACFFIQRICPTRFLHTLPKCYWLSLFVHSFLSSVNLILSFSSRGSVYSKSFCLLPLIIQ